MTRPILTIGGKRVLFCWTQLNRPENDGHGPMCGCWACEHGINPQHEGTGV